MAYIILSKKSMRQVGDRTFRSETAAKGYRLATYGKDAVHFAVVKIKG